MLTNISYEEALNALKKGNKEYFESIQKNESISKQIVLKDKQNPFATVITCSDSRVIPEFIFNQNIGDIFVIRVAGNIVDKSVLGSVEYALEHLNTPLIVVLGHTLCGAVDASFSLINEDKHVGFIQKEIVKARASEMEKEKASILNALNSKNIILENLKLNENQHVISALYNIKTGVVEFINE